MNSSDGSVAQRRSLIVIYVAACLTGVIYAAFHKGIWIDEAFTQFASRHDISLSALWRERWLTDIHPAGHYFYAWLLEPLTGQNIHLARLTNVVPLALSLAAFFWIDPGKREKALLLSVLLLGSALPFDYFVQFRSYYWIICAGTVAAFAMGTALSREWIDWNVAVPMAASSFIALTLHFLSAFFFAVGASIFLAYFWFSGRRKWAIFLAAVLATGCAAMLAQVAFQAPALAYYRVHFWATTTTAQAVFALGSAVALTLVSSAVAWLFALVHWRHTDRADRLVFLLCIAAVVAICVTAIAVNVMRPSIIRQYISPLVPFMLVGVTFAADRITTRRGWLIALLLTCLLVVGLYSAIRAKVKDQEELASIIGAEYALCPGKIVGISPRVAGAPEANVVVTDAFYRSDYETLADRFRFRLNDPVNPDCPIIIWGESFRPVDSFATIAARVGSPITGQQAAAAVSRPSGTGFIILIPPSMTPRRSPG